MNDLLFKKEAYDRVQDRWLHALDTYEQAVVYYLLRQSIGFGRASCAIGFIQMTKGIRDKNDSSKWFTPPIGMSVNKLRGVLNMLADKGALSIKPGDHISSNQYTLNLEWEPVMPLAVPKRLQEKRPTMFDDEYSIDSAAVPHVTPCHTPTSPGAIPHGTGRQYREEKREEREDITPRVAALHDNFSPPEFAQEAESKIAAVKNQSGGKLKPGAKHIDVWRAAFTETFPDAPFMGWVGQEIKSMKDCAARFDQANASFTFHDFVDWSVRNWRAVVKKQLVWHKAPAPLPAVNFFVQHTINGHFFAAFSHRLTRPEDFDYTNNAEYRRHMDNGLNHDQAMQAIGESKGVIKTVRRLKKEQLSEVAAIMQAERDATARQAALKIKQREEYAAREAAKKAPKPVAIERDDFPINDTPIIGDMPTDW